MKEKEKTSIFDAPYNHNDKSTGNRTRIIKIISAFLALLVVIGALLLVKNFLPKKKKNAPLDPKTVFSVKESDLKYVTYKTADTDYTFKKESIKGYNSDGYVWKIEGLESEKQNFTATNNFVSNLCALKGVKMSDSDDELFGFTSPFATVSLMTGGGEYTITIGGDTGSDRYIKIGGKANGTYRITSETLELIALEKYDFATNEPYKIATFSTDVSAYKSSAGALIGFDTLTFFNKDFSEKLVFVPEKQSEDNDKYLVQSRGNAVAKNVDTLFKLFTDTFYIDGVYSYYDNEEDIKAFGLDSPDYEIRLNVGGEEKWFKFKSVDDDNFAVLSDDRHIVTKVSKINIPFLNFGFEDYFE